MSRIENFESSLRLSFNRTTGDKNEAEFQITVLYWRDMQSIDLNYAQFAKYQIQNSFSKTNKNKNFN